MVPNFEGCKFPFPPSHALGRQPHFSRSWSHPNPCFLEPSTQHPYPTHIHMKYICREDEDDVNVFGNVLDSTQ
jgi:hypothetical protein